VFPRLEVDSHRSSTICSHPNHHKSLECDQMHLKAFNTKLTSNLDAQMVLHLHLLWPLQSKTDGYRCHMDVERQSN
jgi:hypothetical protein